MKAAWYEQTGKASEVLTTGEMETPSAENGGVLVRVHASGVNPSDVRARAGLRVDARRMPFPRIIPHSDGAGVIESVGPGVRADRIGERVWIWNGQWQRAFGTAATYISLPSAQAVPLPANTSFEQGACLGIPALTAHACVFGDGPVHDRTVLVTGGAGVVGALAVRMAKLGGARVFATASSLAQAAHARAAGASAVVNHRSTDFAGELRDALAGKTIDRLVEVEFGSNIEALTEFLAPHAIVATYGSAAVPRPQYAFYPLLFKSVTVRYVLVYNLPKVARDAAIADIGRWLTTGDLSPTVSRVFPLQDIASAHESVERGGKLGSVIVSP